MDALIGTRKQFAAGMFRLNTFERKEVIALSAAGNLKPLYEKIINRMNDYELSLSNGDFYCGAMGERVTLNHVSLMLKHDVWQSIDFDVSGLLLGKLCKIFLQSLIDVCEQDGVVELDAQDILRRSAALASGLGVSSKSQPES